MKSQLNSDLHKGRVSVSGLQILRSEELWHLEKIHFN